MMIGDAKDVRKEAERQQSKVICSLAVVVGCFVKAEEDLFF